MPPYMAYLYKTISNLPEQELVTPGREQPSHLFDENSCGNYAENMTSRCPPDPIYVLRGAEAAINVLKFAPRSAREDGLLLSGYVT